MKCQNCGKNEATFYYKSNINGRVMESHLCPECARQLGLVQDMCRPMMSSFWDDDDFFTRPFRMLEPFFGGFGDRMLTEFPRPVNVLEQAQTADPEDTGRDDLLPHDEAMSLALERKRNALQMQLNLAVEAERFEEAAKLRDELRALEQLGAVERIVFAEIPPRVEYSLTAAGEELVPLLRAVETWCARRTGRVE